jgi:hypothetical protein
MSALLGRPLITQPPTHPSASLIRFAEANDLTDADVEMLASIQFRGERPKTPERWAFIYNAIKTSASLDPPRRRR